MTAHEPPSGSIPVSVVVPPRVVSARKTLLMVDDEPDLLSSFKLFVESALPGVTVLTADSAWHGLDLLEKHHVDAAVSDYKMPGMDGGRFFTLASMVAPTVPRILFTAYENDPRLNDLLDAGTIDKVYSKGIGPWEFIAFVCDVLGLPQHEFSAAESTGIIFPTKKTEQT